MSNAPATPGPEPMLFRANREMTVVYKNYRGETSVRRIRPLSQRFGSNEWHKEPQWLLLAFDVEKNANREFALSDMRPT